MLAWFKRIATPAPAALSITEQSAEQVGRVVERLGAVRRPTVEIAEDPAPLRAIVVTSQKGGTGKTTIAAHLAVAAGMGGQGPAVLLDTDPQGSLSEWWDARDEEKAHHDEVSALVGVKLDDLQAKLVQLRRHGAAVAIIDTPPAHTTSIERAIALADLVLIPARPSPHDLRAIGATVNMVRSAGKPYVFVINAAAPRARITAEAIAALSEHGEVAPVVLHQRTNYASSMIDGRTVMETAAPGRSADEVAQLWKYLSARLNQPRAM